MVLTNVAYTKQAKDMAKSGMVELKGREYLLKMLTKINPKAEKGGTNEC